jgi:hypothetical protein
MPRRPDSGCGISHTPDSAALNPREWTIGRRAGGILVYRRVTALYRFVRSSEELGGNTEAAWGSNPAQHLCLMTLATRQ